MRLAAKLALSMGLLIFLISGLGIFSIQQMNNYNDATSQLSDIWLPSTRDAQKMVASALDFRTQELLHVLALRPVLKEQTEEQMRQILNQLAEEVTDYRKVISLPEEEEHLKAFESKWQSYMLLHQEVNRLSREGKQQGASEKIRLESIPIFRSALQEIDTLIQINITESDKIKVSNQKLYSTSLKTVIIVLVISLIAGGVVATVILRGVHAQLGKDPSELEGMAKRVVEGDFNIDDGSEKIGVYGSLVAMVEALQEHINHAEKESENAKLQSQNATKAMKAAEAASQEASQKNEAILKATGEMETVVAVINKAVSQLEHQIDELDHSANDSANRLSEAATAMNEMNATVQEVARNASSASTTSTETKTKANNGAKVVESSLGSISQIHDMSLALKQDMIELNEHAQNITQIMNVISDIADQTNLLALNAAIEAARAGEAGRGFAVVADEVRKLAEKTMASTADVGNAIKSIQESTTKSMSGVDQTVEKIGESSQLANESGAALKEIVTMVDSTSDQVNAIATASEEQSAASEQINQTLLQVNDSVKNTATSMVEASKAVSDVADQSRKLAQLILDLNQSQPHSQD